MPTIEEILLVHHTHTDPGYTGLHADVAAQHAQYLTRVLDLADADPRFRWTIEAGWALERFLVKATKSQQTRLRDSVARGQIELAGFYLQPLTQLGDLEALYQSIGLTMPLARRCGATVRSAILDDVGGASFNLPQVLRYYRIENLILGCGGWRVMLPYAELPHLFYLQGVDGSRVLCWHLGHRRDGTLTDTPAQYGFGLIYFLWPMLKLIDGVQPGIQKGDQQLHQLGGREGIDQLLSRLEREHYPHRRLLLQVACDNGGPEARLTEAIDEWNRRFKLPRIRLGSTTDFFDGLRTENVDKIPTLRGELTCSWTEHAVTHAAATSQFRRASSRLQGVMARAFATGCDESQLASEATSIDRDLAFYADHTFGLSMWFWEDLELRCGSIRDRALDAVRQSWDDKARFSRRALDAVAAIEQWQRFQSASDDPADPKCISVFNPHLFETDGLVEFISVRDRIELQTSAGSSLQVETEPMNSRWFVHRAFVKNMPAMSTRRFNVAPANATAPQVFRAGPDMLESDGTCVKVDPTNGGIASITLVGREWVNATAGAMNDVHLYRVEGVANRLTKCGLDEEVNFNRQPIRGIRFLGHRGGLATASLSVEREYDCFGSPLRVETHYILDASGLRIRNHVRTISSTEKHALYFVFPFAIDEAAYHIAQQGQWTRFPDERIPGSSNHNFGMQDFAAVSNDRNCALFASLDAPVISLGGPHYFHFGQMYPDIRDATIYSLALNNLWNTNCPVHQLGELTFEYRLAFHPGGFDPVRAYRWARLQVSPLVVDPGNASCPPPIACSNDAVMIESIRPIPDGGWRVRLVNLTRKAVTANLTFRDHSGVQVQVESDFDSPIALTGRQESITLQFRAAECKSLRLRDLKAC